MRGRWLVTQRPFDMKIFIITLCAFFSIINPAQSQNSSPVISEADGFVVIPTAKMQPDKNHVYKAIYDATKDSKDPSQILPALNMAGSELNALAVSHVPLANAKFVIVFHGAAIFGILDNASYKKKYGVNNPNLKVLSKFKKAGSQLFVCGQNLLSENIDLKTVSPDVTIASDALIVSMTFQNAGYALMSF
jgi:intracellular sulfur oxidation DsrE/DsrF family protein